MKKRDSFGAVALVLLTVTVLTPAAAAAMCLKGRWYSPAKQVQ